jgi:hypothetical protein
MNIKKCNKCNSEKEINEFYTCNGKPNSICKICKNIQSKKYREDNKNYYIEYNKKYNEENKETLTEYRKEFYKKYNKDGEHHERRKLTIQKNIDVVKKNQKKYRDGNKEKLQKYHIEYAKENKEKLNNYKKEYSKKNPHIKAWITTLNNSLKRLNKVKESKTIEMLGYSAVELKQHIESLFTEGMSWDNYGEWHIDHIKPLSSFPKDTPIKVVNSLSNLQPLWATSREINGVMYLGNLNKNKY